jgi:hypothetical protein
VTVTVTTPVLLQKVTLFGLKTLPPDVTYTGIVAVAVSRYLYKSVTVTTPVLLQKVTLFGLKTLPPDVTDTGIVAVTV